MVRHQAPGARPVLELTANPSPALREQRLLPVSDSPRQERVALTAGPWHVRLDGTELRLAPYSVTASDGATAEKQ